MLSDPASPPSVEFCDQWFDVSPDRPFVVGRIGDIAIDDNPYLHRSFLEIRQEHEFWWIVNVGSHLAATLSDDAGRVHTWLAPGAAIPLVLPVTEVRFTAGPTAYQLGVHLRDPAFSTGTRTDVSDGATTLQPTLLTENQRRCVLALCEPTLRRSRLETVQLPSNADAAARLDWTMPQFNRQLDAVCQKLTAAGVRGLHGGSDRLATSRRARLVEYALATRLVGPDDLHLLGLDRAPHID